MSTRTRSSDGSVGFYRAYSPGAFASLGEAIEWTMRVAEAWNLVEVEVQERATRAYPEGGFYVALVGRKRPPEAVDPLGYVEPPVELPPLREPVAPVVLGFEA